MKMSDYIGFYSLNGEPCRVFADAEGVVRAERYVKSKGYEEMLVSDVVWSGNTISEKTFKQMVVTLTGRG
jgi:hypothetical protein